MYGQRQGQRPVGVKIPDHQDTTQSSNPDLTIENIAPIEFYAVEYVEKGKVVMGLFCLSGGEFYLAPEGSTWLKSMRHATVKISENLRSAVDRIKGKVVDVPSEDVVDVIAASSSSPSDAVGIMQEE